MFFIKRSASASLLKSALLKSAASASLLKTAAPRLLTPPEIPAGLLTPVGGLSYLFGISKAFFSSRPYYPKNQRRSRNTIRLMARTRGRPTTCYSCDPIIKFHTVDGFNSHNDDCHPDDEFICKKCGSRYAKEDQLIAHEKWGGCRPIQKKNYESEVIPGATHIICIICGKNSFNQEKQYCLHCGNTTSP